MTTNADEPYDRFEDHQRRNARTEAIGHHLEPLKPLVDLTEGRHPGRRAAEAAHFPHPHPGGTLFSIDDRHLADHGHAREDAADD